MTDMAQQERKTTFLKKIRFWTIFLLVISGFSTLNGLRGIPNILNPVKTDTGSTDAAIQKLADDLYNMASTTGYKVFSLLQTALVIATFVLLILAFQKLNQGKFPQKLAYFLYILLHIVTVAQSVFIPMPSIEGFNLGGAVIVLVGLFNLVLIIPAIFALVRLYQAEPEV